MLRSYTGADLPALLDAWEAASRRAHPFLSEDFLAQERVNIGERWIPASATTVAVVDGAVVGFMSLVGDEVGGIFVHPDHQEKGIGRALMDHAVAVRGAVELEVFERNTAGRAFYQRYGFREIGRVAHDDTGQTCLRLRFGD